MKSPSERSDGCNSCSDKDGSGAHAKCSVLELHGAETARFRSCRIQGRFAYSSYPRLAFDLAVSPWLGALVISSDCCDARQAQRAALSFIRGGRPGD